MNRAVPFENPRHFASGGNGDLYLAELRADGVTVVVKALRKFKVPLARQTFAREIQVLRRKLPGVVTILFADPDAPQPYYVMPFFSGGCLGKYAGRLDSQQLQAVVLDLARTLASFHAMVGSHGDYKPANILVSGKGEVKVADPSGNGIGCTMLFPQNPGGTPGYWAPEVRTKGISRAGDVYSFGTTVYELVTGCMPRDGQGFVPTPWQRATHPKLWEVIECCCQIDPQARPTMSEVVRMLEGTSWAEIQEARKRTKSLLTAAAVVGGIFLLDRFLVSG